MHLAAPTVFLQRSQHAPAEFTDVELMSWPARFMPCCHFPQPVAGGGGGEAHGGAAALDAAAEDASSKSRACIVVSLRRGAALPHRAPAAEPVRLSRL